MAIIVEDFFGRARREEGAYREYATDEQRRPGEKRPTGMVMNGATDPLAQGNRAAAIHRTLAQGLDPPVLLQLEKHLW